MNEKSKQIVFFIDVSILQCLKKTVKTDCWYIIFLHICLFLQGSGGITIKKSGQALIIGIYDEPLTPGQCNMIVERLGDYLIEQGM